MSEPILIAKSGKDEIFLLPQMANRHGLIAGATGTGKTVTLQSLAQSFSQRGVPVFMADVKGDLAGMQAPAKPPTDSSSSVSLPPTKRHPSPSGTSSGKTATLRAPRSPRWVRCCSRDCSI